MSDTANLDRRTLVATIRSALHAAADPERAPAQQAYMKSDMPFLGIPVPLARSIARAAAKGVKDAEIRLGAARELWDEASHREERYAALTLIDVRATRGLPATIELAEHMARTGQWWDFTDELARRVGERLDVAPAPTAVLIRAWATDDDFWMRRLAILSQLGRGERTDRALLADTIEPNLADNEFFIRKAIGWSLRELAKVDAEWVRAYVVAHELSPLSRREALKHLQ